MQRWQMEQIAAGRNFDDVPITQVEWDAAFRRVCEQNNYDDWRERRDIETQDQRSFWKGTEELDLAALPEKVYDRPKLQPFKIKYDTLEEVRMRFNKTVIMVKGNAFTVTDQRMVKDRIYVLLEDHTGTKKYIAMDDIPDLRPPPSMYLQCNSEAGYLVRSPSRVNQQGMTTNSVHLRRVGSRDYLGWRPEDLRDSLSKMETTVIWTEIYRPLIVTGALRTLRLSHRVALYQKSDDVVAEYKGRRLGILKDHAVQFFDDDDKTQPWVKRDLSKVHLEIAP
jgi:hypothetical protein